MNAKKLYEQLDKDFELDRILSWISVLMNGGWIITNILVIISRKEKWVC
jgi:hypothetical protein